jgi:LmbE family N-acetylglucosaminyl deacetylase
MNAIMRGLLTRFARVARPYLRTYGLLQTAKVFNQSALVWNPGAERVVVLAPHMDDETIGCGGTLARHVASGAQVSVIFLTDGRRGGGSAHHSGLQELIRTRRREAQSALEVLGISQMHCLDLVDGELSSTPAAAARLRELLLAGRPELIYLPCFLEEHPDHRAASQLLLDATEGTSLSVRCQGYEVWTPLFPNCLVNIDSVLEQKRTAVLRYRSQLDGSDYLHTQLGLNAYRSTALAGAGCRYAEAFLSVSLAQYRELHAAYRQWGKSAS